MAYQIVDDFTREPIPKGETYWDVETNCGTVYVTKHVRHLDTAIQIIVEESRNAYPFTGRIKKCRAA